MVGKEKIIITIIVKFITGLLLIPKVFNVCSVSEQSPPFVLFFIVLFLFFNKCIKTHQSL